MCPKDDGPEYGFFGWSSMLFCCGVGASLILYGTTEWVDYYLKPPFGAEPRSSEAIAWASSYGMFHWGIIGWAIYCFPGVAVGYSYYNRNSGSLKTSTGCESVLGNKKLAKLIDSHPQWSAQQLLNSFQLSKISLLLSPACCYA